MKGKPSPNKGKNMKEETKRKISESRTGKISSFKGKHHSEESNEKNRQAHLGKKKKNL